MLADEGATILKFFLHVSKDEQAERLRARLDDPAKNWKFRSSDLEEREHWDEYQDAYQEMVRRTAASLRRGSSCRPTASGTATW